MYAHLEKPLKNREEARSLAGSGISVFASKPYGEVLMDHPVLLQTMPISQVVCSFGLVPKDFEFMSQRYIEWSNFARKYLNNALNPLSVEGSYTIRLAAVKDIRESTLSHLGADREFRSSTSLFEDVEVPENPAFSPKSIQLALSVPFHFESIRILFDSMTVDQALLCAELCVASLSEESALRICQQVLDSPEYLHAEEYVHNLLRETIATKPDTTQKRSDLTADKLGFLVDRPYVETTMKNPVTARAISSVLRSDSEQGISVLRRIYLSPTGDFTTRHSFLKEQPLVSNLIADVCDCFGVTRGLGVIAEAKESGRELTWRQWQALLDSREYHDMPFDWAAEMVR